MGFGGPMGGFGPIHMAPMGGLVIHLVDIWGIWTDDGWYDDGSNDGWIYGPNDGWYDGSI